MNARFSIALFWLLVTTVAQAQESSKPPTQITTSDVAQASEPSKPPTQITTSDVAQAPEPSKPPTQITTSDVAQAPEPSKPPTQITTSDCEKCQQQLDSCRQRGFDRYDACMERERKDARTKCERGLAPQGPIEKMGLWGQTKNGANFICNAKCLKWNWKHYVLNSFDPANCEKWSFKPADLFCFPGNSEDLITRCIEHWELGIKESEFSAESGAEVIKISATEKSELVLGYERLCRNLVEPILGATLDLDRIPVRFRPSSYPECPNCIDVCSVKK
jgi:hypothetical protein